MNRFLDIVLAIHLVTVFSDPNMRELCSRHYFDEISLIGDKELQLYRKVETSDHFWDVKVELQNGLFKAKNITYQQKGRQLRGNGTDLPIILL